MDLDITLQNSSDYENGTSMEYNTGNNKTDEFVLELKEGVKITKKLLENNVDPDQTVRMHRLIWIYVGLIRLKEISIIGLALSWFWAALIIILNLIVIVIICGYKKRSRLYFYLLNLAIADLGCGLLSALPHAIERTTAIDCYLQAWVADEVTCKIQRTLEKTCIMTSNYLLAAMSMDRAYVICKPMMNIRRGSILQKAIVVSCWLLCFLCSSPLLKYTSLVHYNPYLKFLTRDLWNCALTAGPKGYKIQFILVFVFGFAIPLVIITSSYILLVVSIYRRAFEQTQSQRRQETSERDRLTMSRVFNKGVPKSKVKSIKLTIGIVLSFFVCWMAYFVGSFLNLFRGVYHPSMLIWTTFYFWNSIANPILFFVYHRKKVRARSSTWVSSETTQMKCLSNTEGLGSARNKSASELVNT